ARVVAHRLQAPERRAEAHADATAVLVVDLEPAVLERLGARDERERGAPVVERRALAAEQLADVEVDERVRGPRRQRLLVELAGLAAGRTLSVAERRREQLGADSHRRDRAEARDRDRAQSSSLKIR